MLFTFPFRFAWLLPTYIASIRSFQFQKRAFDYFFLPSLMVVLLSFHLRPLYIHLPNPLPTYRGRANQNYHDFPDDVLTYQAPKKLKSQMKKKKKPTD